VVTPSPFAHPAGPVIRQLVAMNGVGAAMAQSMKKRMPKMKQLTERGVL